MDDDRSRRDDTPRLAAADEPLEPPAPPQPPATPATGWATPGRWPAAQAAPERLDVASIVGRTFDTLGREWSLFLALAVPAGLGGFASAALSTSFQEILRDPAAATRGDQLPFIAAQVLIAILTGISTLATVVAADALWRGRPIGLSAALGTGLALVPRALGLLLLGLLIAVAFGAALVAALLLIGVLGPGGAFIGILGFIVVLAASVYVSARLSLLLPVLALEDVPVLGVIGRTWRLTRGSVLLLFATALVIGICGLFPAWGGTVFSLFVEDRVVAGIALALATMVTAPLSGIWTVLAWGTLTRAPYGDSPVMTAGRGRVTGILLVIGVGFVLMLIGGALAGTGSAEFLRRLEGI